jgi:hypothetical protein
MSNRKPILNHPIIRAGSKVTGVAPEVLAGDCRDAHIVLRRHKAMIAGHLMGFGYAEMGRIFARDHTTIMSAVQSKPGLYECSDVKAIIREVERIEDCWRGVSVVIEPEPEPTPVPEPAPPPAARRRVQDMPLAVPTGKHKHVWQQDWGIALARRDNIHRW